LQDIQPTHHIQLVLLADGDELPFHQQLAVGEVLHEFPVDDPGVVGLDEDRGIESLLKIPERAEHHV